MPGYVDRVAAQALAVRPTRALIAVLSTPFYLLGFVIGVLWLVVTFAYAAAVEGFVEARTRLATPVPPPGEDESS